MKAILLNSADDIGNPGVDYLSGYGSLNAYRAVNAILNRNYIEDSIIQNGTKNFSIAVPEGILKLKLMLVWNDPAAAPNPSKALINDLDLQVKFPASNETWQPWVLDGTADAASLQAGAQRKRDSLNNVEQISLDHPAAGNYTIEVKGSKMISSQLFTIAYQFDTASVFYWTYPSFNDPLISKNTQWLRWETDRSGGGEIEYATDGNNWRLAGRVPDISSKYFRWPVPDTVTTAVLRMRFQSTAAVLSDTFAISPQLDMQVGFNCADSFLLYWNAAPAKNYTVYQLGDKYLQAFTQQPDTSVIINKQQHPSLHYSVMPVINGRQGVRSNTINYLSAGPECYIRAFFLQSQDQATARFTAELGTSFNVIELTFEKRSASGFVTVKTTGNPFGVLFSFVDSSLTEGENHYRLRVKLAGGAVVYSNIEIVYHLPAKPVLLFPNPASQNGTLTVITNESGRYRIEFFNSIGKLVYSQLLNSTLTKINTRFFARGMHAVRIVDRKGKPFSQKLLIY